MLQLHNRTPFAANMALFPNEEAIDTLYLLVKATFIIGKQWTLADEQLPPLEGDEYWGEPGESSIKQASDYHIGKLSSDIIMLGHAFAPGGKDVRQLDVRLTVGKVHKTVRVFGDRCWRDGRISSPQPFRTMAMVYEKAFGGAHIVDGQIVETEVRNPIGCGFAGKRKSSEMNDIPLPNLEDPDSLIVRTGQRPIPAGFGFVCPHWLPRSGFSGTYDEAWQAQRAPYLPVDFDKRFFSMAHPDLIYPGFLKGGESVEITHMHPGGTVNFELPFIQLHADVNIMGNSLCPQFNLETLVIEPNQLTLSMTWRAAVPCNKKALAVSDVKISMSR